MIRQIRLANSLFVPALLVMSVQGMAASPQPPAAFQGAAVGEIRAFAFGGDTQTVSFWNGTKLVSTTLRDLGWLSCEGQSLDDGEFPELAALLKSPPPPASTSSIWGSQDLKHDFSIPDLRGMFLRGYMPSKPVSPNPAGEPGDGRMPPRPDVSGSGANQGTTNPDGVGSFQFYALQRHRHVTHNFSYAQDHSGGAIGGWENTPGKDGYTDEVYQANVADETRPSNVHVMYCIWTGRVVTGATITPAQQK